MSEYSDMPKILKWIMIFTDRVGFPIVMALLLCYLCWNTISKNTAALTELKISEDNHAKTVMDLAAELKSYRQNMQR